MPKRFLILISNGISDRKQMSQQNLSLNLLNARRVLYETVDGADPDPLQIHRRNDLFKISGIRGKYPQWFIVDEDENVTYIGDWETISEINDNDDLPPEILASHPDIMTWNKRFGGIPNADPVRDDHPMIRRGSYRGLWRYHDNESQGIKY